MSLDRNARDPHRVFRNSQRERNGGATADIKLTTNGGLVLTSNTLGVKLASLNPALTLTSGLQVTVADASLSKSSGGLSVNVGAAGGLSVPSLPLGLGIKLADTSLATSASGANVNLAANSGLQVSSGLLLKLADTSMQLAAGGVSVKLATNSGLQVSSGLLLQLADTSLQLAAGGVSVKPATNGGLSVSTGLVVTGRRLVTSDPGSPANGDTWYNTTSNQAKIRSIGMTTHLPLVLVADGKGTAVANTNAFTATNAVASLPAAFLVAGRSVRVKAWGTYACAANSNVVIGAFIDAANSIGDGMTVTLTAGQSGRWYYEAVFTCITTGTTATVRSGGFGYNETASTNLAVFGNTLNVTTANALTCESVAQWTVANVGNTLTSFGCEINVIG